MATIKVPKLKIENDDQEGPKNPGNLPVTKSQLLPAFEQGSVRYFPAYI